MSGTDTPTPTPKDDKASIGDKAKSFISHPSMKWIGGAVALAAAGALGYGARGMVEKRRNGQPHGQLSLSMTPGDNASAPATTSVTASM